MSSRREKKVKRIRTMRIWPTAVGLVIFTTLFTVMLCFVLNMFIQSIVQNSTADSIKSAGRAYSTFINNYRRGEDNSSLYSCIISSIPQISGLSISSGDAEQESFGREFPVSESDLTVVDSVVSPLTVSESQCTVYFSKKENPEVEYDGKKGFSFFLLIPEFFSFDSLSESDGFIAFSDRDFPFYNLWCEFYDASTDTDVRISTDVTYSFTDLLYIGIGFIALVMFILVLAIYHLISLLGLLSEKDRFYDAIYTDPVTGENGWEYFAKRAQKSVKKSANQKYKLAMVHIRTEKYRSFCTCFGVKEGEELTEQLFREIKKNLNRGESAARYERADFGLLVNYTDEARLERRLEELLTKLDNVRRNQKFYFNAGICPVSSKTDTVEALYSNACTARASIDYESDACIAWFSEKLHNDQLWEHKVENDAARAIENHEFALYLQPKYSAKGESLSGAEALVRWNHPTEGFITPGRFIPIFEKNGFILLLDDYMLREIAMQQAKWISEGRRVVPISVNVSRAHFTRSDLAEHILSIVDEYRVPHELIELELTESAFFDDKNELISTVKKLRSYGFHVSMDDFGTGFSSLNSLKELPLDVVKLDAEFFRGGDSKRGELIVEKTIGLAKDLGMRIVAEGIETREQVDFLAESNCDLIQGFYFAKPMPVGDFEKCAFNSESLNSQQQ